MENSKELEEQLKQLTKDVVSFQKSAVKSMNLADEKIKECVGDQYPKVKDIQNRLMKAIMDGNEEMQESLKNDLEKIVL